MTRASSFVRRWPAEGDGFRSRAPGGAVRHDPAPRVDRRRPLTICLITSELLGWGNAGGFGFATRSIARGLAHRGHTVCVVLPRPRGQTESRLELDGFTVIGCPRGSLLRSGAIFREVDADIYHSQEPSVLTYLAQRARPTRVHLVTSRDPRDHGDWWIELRHRGLRSLLPIALYENPATYRAVRQADGTFVPAKYLAAKAQRKYGLARAPEFLPTPVAVPARVRKAPQPTVCFVGRLDPRKRPERFLALAERFPEVTFKLAGHAQVPAYERELRARYQGRANVDFLGFIEQFSDPRLSALLAESWALVNTSTREGLPNTFVEAAGHGCAIVSELDPDRFTSRFGVLVRDGDFAEALAAVLAEDAWRELGAAGRRYVRATNDPEGAIRLHLHHYHRALGATTARSVA